MTLRNLVRDLDFNLHNTLDSEPEVLLAPPLIAKATFRKRYQTPNLTFTQDDHEINEYYDLSFPVDVQPSTGASYRTVAKYVPVNWNPQKVKIHVWVTEL